MRISDGSSDVCSSDLVVVDAHDRGQLERAVDGAERLGGGHGAPAGSDGVSETLNGSRGQAICEASWPSTAPPGASEVDRTGVVSGKRGSVRLDTGGRCTIT